MITSQETNQALSDLGFAIKSSTPLGAVDENNWPHILYNVTLSLKGKQVWSGPYRLGVGHVDAKKARSDGIVQPWTEAERSTLYTWQSKPHADFKDKTQQARIAGKLAKLQKVTPQLADVLHSLLMDGEAFFNAQSFEDWAAEYGYDADCRKAEAIYRACDVIGRKLKANVPQETLDKASELLKDH